jgi:hypothetical protein
VYNNLGAFKIIRVRSFISSRDRDIHFGYSLNFCNDLNKSKMSACCQNINSCVAN